jgi:DNA-binding phage protein
MIDEDRLKEVCYAVDEDGSFVLAESAGWDPKNIANDQAWDLIHEQVKETLEKIKSGKLSPLAYHMVRNQMGLGLLAKYAGLNRLRVWRHLKPAGFKRLKRQQLKRYAKIFGIDVADLAKIPEDDV